MTMYYFAYGSNMLTARLAERVPTVRPIGHAWLSGHRLYFHLRGHDESGKCNIVHTGKPGDVVHGVLFELDATRLERLHAAEGPAYAFLELDVNSTVGVYRAAIYRGRSDWLDDDLIPFGWYRDFVTHGARQHGLPLDYVDWLSAVATMPDPDPDRAAHNARILRQQPANAIAAPGG